MITTSSTVQAHCATHTDYQLAASVELFLSYRGSLGFTIKLNQDAGLS